MLERETVYDFVNSQENAFKTTEIAIIDGLRFNFYETIRTAALYKNSQLLTGKDDNKPVRNITLPLLRLQYRSEGFDVKDIDLYINDKDEYYKSFLVRKFHEKWARENDMDTFIDQVVESYVDYGLALVKDVNDVKPEVVDLQSIAFCDQTDILGGPLCIKHSFSPDQLRNMEDRGWDKDAIETVIAQAGFYRVDKTGALQNKTPGKYIEVYELHGTLPEDWLTDEEPKQEDDENLVRQLQVITFYKDKNENKHGITLFRGKESDSPFEVVLRDPIYGRALGLGGAEELFEPQVWTNYDAIRIKGLLDQASKVIYQTTDPAYASRNQTTDLENGEIMVVAENKRIDQVQTSPVNISLFERSVQDWYAHAQELAGASPFLLGDQSGMKGTAFRSIAALIQQGMSIHDYRQGKIAVFFEKLYRTRFLPQIAKEIAKGKTFLSELSLDELQQVAESLQNYVANATIKDKILNGEVIDPQEIDQLKQTTREQFMKGNKKFIEILKGELKDLSYEIRISIKSKQQDFAGKVDQLSKILGMVIQTGGQVLQDPTMAKLFNQILEYSGLEPLDFASIKPSQQNPQQNPQGQMAAPAMPMNAGPQMPVPQMVMGK